jgi:aspartate aminotransferase
VAVLEVGDEVLYPRPGWFNDAALIRGAAGTPVPIDLTPRILDLDSNAISAAIGPRTRMVIVERALPLFTHATREVAG